MTIDRNKWEALAKKYDSKAKWAEALLFISPEDHDDLLSALVELDPKDLADYPKKGTVTYTHVGVPSIQVKGNGEISANTSSSSDHVNWETIETIDVDKLKITQPVIDIDYIEDTLKKSQDQLEVAAIKIEHAQELAVNAKNIAESTQDEMKDRLDELEERLVELEEDRSTSHDVHLTLNLPKVRPEEVAKIVSRDLGGLA